MEWIRPEKIGARTARTGARFRRDGTARRWISSLTRRTPRPPRSCRTLPRRCATRPASCGRWCARRGWTGAHTASASSTRSSSRAPGTKFSICLRMNCRGSEPNMALPRSIGGSYGWSSAGRFHHAQSQVHRFLNTAFGGYVRSVNSYSAGASAVILPHVDGRLRGRLAPQRDLGSGRRAYRYRAGLRRHGAEELGCRKRRHQPAHRARRDAKGRAPRRDILRHRAVARRHAGSGRRPVAADQGRHRRGADAGARAHAARRKSVGQRLCRALLHRLRNLRTLSARPRRQYAKGRGMGGRYHRHSCRHDRRPRPPVAARAHLDHGLALIAACAIWRAAGVDGRGARGHARPDRPARRRI